MKKINIISMFLTLFLLSATTVSAHVVVKPAEVGVGERLNFTVSVPTEESVPTTQIRLLIPESLQNVRPNVKPGWNIELVKTGEGDDARISEILWSGGTIPAEQRDEFIFSAQAPAEPTELIWKAYQTYADGTLVSWDANPDMIEAHDSGNQGAAGTHAETALKPYSATGVINDLAENTEVESTASPVTDNLLVYGVLLSLGLSGVSLYLQLKKK